MNLLLAINSNEISELLSLKNGKTSLSKEKEVPTNTQSDNIKSEFKDFLSNLLINTKAQTTNESKLLSTKENNNIKIEKEKPNLLNNEDKQSSTKKMTLNEVLNFALYLKSNGFKGKFPTDTKKIDTLLTNKQAIQDFKNIKNIKDLFHVAKKYNIKIEKFEFFKEDDKKIILTTKKDIEKIIKKNDIISKKQPLEKTREQTKTKDIKSTSEEILNLSKNKQIKKSDTIFQKQPLEKILQNISNNHKKEVKEPTIQNISENKTSLKQSQSVQTKNDLPIINDTNLSKNISNLKKNEKHTPIKEKEIKITPNLDTDKKTLQTKNIITHKETKTTQKHNSKNQTKIEKNTSQTNPINTPEKHIFTSENNIGKINTNHQNVQIKQTLQYFANDLNQEIQNYKPPLSRIKMTLNPKNLGNVDVSIVSRGNNLQVNISSNNNTMAIFTQNQAEFKNSLVNMGFSNLNMNFNSNSNSHNEQRNRSNKENNNFEEISDNDMENQQTITLIVPKYI